MTLAPGCLRIQNLLPIAGASGKRTFRHGSPWIPWTGKSCFSNRALAKAIFEAPKCHKNSASEASTLVSTRKPFLLKHYYRLHGNVWRGRPLTRRVPKNFIHNLQLGVVFWPLRTKKPTKCLGCLALIVCKNWFDVKLGGLFFFCFFGSGAGKREEVSEQMAWESVYSH